MAFRFAPGQSHSAARAAFHRSVRGENVDEDELEGAPAALEANVETGGNDENGEESTAVRRARRRDDEARLFGFLFNEYDDYVFPGKGLEVSFGMSLQCASYDRSTHLLTSRHYQRILWKDERLVWNASDFGGIDTIRVRPWRIWIPDIQLYNEADYEGCKEWVNAVVLSTGTVIWFPPTKFRSFCQPTGKTSAECALKIGSWSYSSDFLSLTSFKYTHQVKQFDLDQYIDDCPYIVSNVESKVTENKYEEYDSPFHTLDVKFNIKASN